MTDFADTLAALLADPLEQTHHRRIADRAAEEYADPRAALVALVCAHPKSDGPRLAFAEWCEANGERERAEFVRVQCDLARGPEGITCEHVSSSRHGEFTCLPFLSEPIPRRRARVTARVFAEPPHIRTWQTFTGTVREIHRFDEHSTFVIDNATGRDWKPEFSRREWELLSQPWRFRDWSKPCPMKGGWVSEFHRGFVANLTCTAADWLAHCDSILREHPIESVRLTTWPDPTELWERNISNHPMSRIQVKPDLEHHFRGIAFTLPQPLIA